MLLLRKGGEQIPEVSISSALHSGLPESLRTSDVLKLPLEKGPPLKTTPYRSGSVVVKSPLEFESRLGHSGVFLG